MAAAIIAQKPTAVERRRCASVGSSLTMPRAKKGLLAQTRKAAVAMPPIVQSNTPPPPSIALILGDNQSDGERDCGERADADEALAALFARHGSASLV